MAENFKVEKAQIRKTLIDVAKDPLPKAYEAKSIIIDISAEWVDLLIDRSQYRWDRRTGKLVDRDDGRPL